MTETKLFEGVDFNVATKPVFGQKVDGHDSVDYEQCFSGKKFITFRTDTDEPLGIVSDKYQLIQHKDNILKAYNAIKELSDDFSIKNYMPTAGRIFTEFIINTDAVIPHSNNDETAKIRVLFQNSYDTSLSWGYRLSFMRRVCQNLMVGFVTTSSAVFRHMKRDVDFTELEHLPDHIQNYKKEYVQFYDYLKDIEITVNRMNLIKENLPQKATEFAVKHHLIHKGKTAWDLYNEYTYFYTRTKANVATKDSNIKFISQFFLSPTFQGV